MNGYAENLEAKATVAPPEPGEEIVISGIAGKFPECDNVHELRDKLYNKEDLITNDGRRWHLDHPEIPQRTGKINAISKFDALFFGVHFKQAHTMDPMCRMILEHAYEAVVDAGVNPRHLRGTKCGVFVGACFSESEKSWLYEKLQVNGFGVTGCSRAMLANRISYWLGVTGPSYTVDSACSSSLFAMEHAYRAIRTGQVDAAIVGGANLCLHPYVSLQFSRLGVLSADGRCKSFDNEANGYTRSEACAVVFLQKAKDAKRVYATYIHAKTNCDGYKEQGITFPSSVMQSVLLDEFYQEIGLSPACLSFLEAHGTGTKVGDPEEINAIDKVICKKRKTPLLIGSVKSNLGHSEPASGVCSIAKVIIGMENGKIPPNINYKSPRVGAKALEEGKLIVVTEPTKWDGGYVGVNSFGFGGANAHILLKSNEKEKVNNGLPEDDLPRLVAVSGRTEEAVQTLLDDVESRPVDAEHVALLHNVHSEEIQGHLYRGYTILHKNGNKPLREIESYSGEKRPICFVFSGMGSQWPGMGQALIQFPVFAKAIQKCDAVLKPRGVDIIDILTNPDKKTFDSILNCFVGIAAVQIGLVDLLTSVGIAPDLMIGHSVGELGCAYADGCCTAEQMVLFAYFRGKASLEAGVIQGSMAAVGLGYDEMKDLCPPDIDVACHNSAENCTISGPTESMKAFVAKLQANKIFAKEVPTGNIPYHSRYIKVIGAKLLSYLKEVAPNPVARSEKWLSTSVPRNKWSTTMARFSSPEYHTNNLLSPVLFEETATYIPRNAVTIEIAPHALLQAILRRSLDPNIINIPLTQRGHKDNVEVFLTGIGKLFNAGYHPQIQKFYPAVEFPVSRGTPMISPHIRWEHSEDWYVTCYQMQEKITSGERIVEIAATDENHEYMTGHVIDGRNLIPAMGYLALVWETIGLLRGEIHTEISVVFEDVKFIRATTIPKEGSVELTVMVQKGTGRFEVIEGGNAVVTGQITAMTDLTKHKVNRKFLEQPDEEEDEPMTTKDIYKELRLRGYQYSGVFRALKSSSTTGRRGTAIWMNNWVAFMDNMLQMKILSHDTGNLYVPTAINKLVIDTKAHLASIRAVEQEEEKLIPVLVSPELDVIVSGGIEIRGAKASSITRRKPTSDPVLEEYKFIAHRDRAEMSVDDAIRTCTHLALENVPSIKVKTIELVDEEDDATVENLISPVMVTVLGDLPLIQANVQIAADPERFEEDALPQNVTVNEIKKLPSDHSVLLAIGTNLLSPKKSECFKQLMLALRDGGYLISLESKDEKDLSPFQRFALDIVVEKCVNDKLLVLLKKKEKIAKRTLVVYAKNDEFSWIEEIQKILQEEDERDHSGHVRLFVVSEDPESGVLGFVNCIRKEPGGDIVRSVFIQDRDAPKFSLSDPFYRDQLELDLASNVLRPGGVWGSYRHVLLPPLQPKPTYHAVMNQVIRGDLSALRWLEGPLQPEFRHENLVKVVYSSINFRDIMITTGKLGVEVIGGTRFLQECPIGFEYSGINAKGRRVMGLIDTKAFTNVMVSDDCLIWEVPDEWSLEDAATIPSVYATCCYALFVHGRMKKGEKILIHSGTGGVGQAAITLALFNGCEVFTTVGTPEKRQFIKDTFPQIDDDHIGNSRDTSFEQMVLRVTNGEGVNLVLNSLAEEKLFASVRCLAKQGRFLEIGKFDIASDNKLGMERFSKEISFHGIMLDNLFSATRDKKMILKNALDEVLALGAVKPLVRKVFSKNELETAFRYMAAGKHIGKVLIKVREEDEPLSTPILAYPNYTCQPNKSYVILGGLGGFGIELMEWLVLRGAMNLVLTSRHGIKNGYQRMRIERCRSYGRKILIITGQNAAIPEECEFILRTAENMGPVDAIFNLAVVLKDNPFKKQTQESFEESFKTKAWATKTLDEVSRKICPQLRKFVCFSSVSCGRGNAEQTNYGMSNSVMERICERRVADGLPGLAIQWGAIGDVGLVADMQDSDKELVIGGTLQQKISSCLQELNVLLQQDKPVVGSMVVAEKRSGAYGANDIVGTVLNIMGVKDLKSVSQHTSLAELGMDSLMGVEIKQTLEREFEVFLTAQDIRSLNFAKLKEMASKDKESKKNANASGEGNTEELAGIKLLIRTIGTHMSYDICREIVPKTDSNKSEVFLIPGIEGMSTIFEPLASKLKHPTTCLQLGLNFDNQNTIQDMAKYFLPAVLERLKNRRDFKIIGYSYGSLVAIELARLLENEGYNGRLVLLDGSPQHMKLIIEQHIPYGSEEELQRNILVGIADIVAPYLSSELLMELEKYSTWEERLNLTISRLPEVEEQTNLDINVSNEEKIALCTSVLTRLKALDAYTSSAIAPIKSSITLLKPTIPPVRNNSDDYDLNQLTTDRVEIFYVEGNHVSMLDHEKIVKAIHGESLEDAAAFKASIMNRPASKDIFHGETHKRA